MYIVLLLAAAALVCGSSATNVNRHMRILDMNHIQSNLPRQSKRFITISKRPAGGRATELTCEAVAAPAPSVHWFRNDAPLYEYDKESNEIMDTNPSSLGRVVSTVLVGASDSPAEYTCLIVSGSNTKRASTVVYGSAGGPSERSRLRPRRPRILVSYKVLVDVIGAAVALPCRARAHPRPALTWTDNTGRPVGDDTRMKVLRSGELVISHLRWEDMGEFVCRASNIFGTTETKTFVYPARPDDQDG